MNRAGGRLRETRTSDYFLSDITISSRPILDRISVRASVKNAFDTEYRLPGGFEHRQVAIPQHGRHLLVEMRYRP